MKNILITGSSGMLGGALCKELSKYYNIYCTGKSSYKSFDYRYKKFNLSSKNYDELIKWSNPNIIILSGAITDGNYCNENPLEANLINGISVKKFLKSTNQSVKIIYISTDAVFSNKTYLAKENDLTNPKSVYGKSKELGEYYLLNSNRKFIIIRTTIIGLNSNKNKKGFVEWIINSSINEEKIKLFQDVIFNPISIWDLSKEILYLIKTSKFNNKIFHISGDELITKYKFGIKLLKELNLPTNNIKVGNITSFKNRVKRSTDQSLDCTLYKNLHNRKLPNIDLTLNSIKKKYYEKN